MIGKNIGYRRVSSEDPNTARQLDRVPLDREFTDEMSGSSRSRPDLKKYSFSAMPMAPTCMRPGCRCRDVSMFQHTLFQQTLMLKKIHPNHYENNPSAPAEVSPAIIKEEKKLNKCFSFWLNFCCTSSSVGIRETEEFQQDLKNPSI